MISKRSRFSGRLLLTVWVGCLILQAAGVSADGPGCRIGLEARPWPEADRLFRSDPRFLGADDAYAVDLEDGRVLWLLGDSFIGDGEKRSRGQATVIRNCVGIQTGYNPATAAMAFAWRSFQGAPASFFPESGNIWFWPGDGVRLDKGLLIFLMAMQAADNPLGFAAAGWRAVRIPDIQGPPRAWRVQWLPAVENPWGVVVGSASVFQKGRFVYAYGYKAGTQQAYLVRWPEDRARTGDLANTDWWVPSRNRWIAQQALERDPGPLFSGGQSEFTVHPEPETDGVLAVQTVGFGPAWIGFRTADRLTGPFSDPVRFYRPEEHDTPGIMIYAAKAHPHLAGAPLVLTYCTNAFDFSRVLADPLIYYPRFLRVRFTCR